MTSTVRKGAAVVAALVVLSTLTPMVASAQTDSGDDSLVSVGIDVLTSPVDFATGISDRARLTLGSTFGDEPDANAAAEAIRSDLDSNSDRYTSHANGVADEYNYSVANGTTVYELTVSGDEDVSIYVIAESDGENITGYDAVNSTDKSVAQSFEISATQAEQLHADIEAYDDEYVSDGEVPDRGYYISQATKYGDWREFV